MFFGHFKYQKRFMKLLNWNWFLKTKTWSLTLALCIFEIDPWSNPRSTNSCLWTCSQFLYSSHVVKGLMGLLICLHYKCHGRDAKGRLVRFVVCLSIVELKMLWQSISHRTGLLACLSLSPVGWVDKVSND